MREHFKTNLSSPNDLKDAPLLEYHLAIGGAMTAQFHIQ